METGTLAIAIVILVSLALVTHFRGKAESAVQKAQDDLNALVSRLQAAAKARLDEVDAQLAAERDALRAEGKRIQAYYEAEFSKAVATLNPLRRFEGIADAESEARRILDEAVALAQALRTQVEGFAEQAKKQSDEEVREANAKLRQLRAEADTILEKATATARLMVDQAHLRAEGIAGSAYTALREKDSLEQAVKAIRNIIDGYGDRYVIPTHSLIDELAADYSHLEAGEALKTARAQSRRMVEEEHAAVCAYAEAKRRETAIRFVLDAFNGRVDAILSRSRHDNLGTLEQEIKDAFSLVNLNGEAFRNARILEAYLEARLAELKWAVAAHELRQREREEQRLMQEQIREEEKAQREIERALKETAKEEESLKKALEKARAEVATGTEEQRAAFEAKIAELNRQLAEAEAKNQRALSMAQQTKAGSVYVISNIGSFGDDVVKIGMTRRLEPLDRVKELGDASVPFGFDVHALIRTDDAPALERELHSRFAEYRVNLVNYRKEFFRIPVIHLRDFVSERKLAATFTMAAEAREYRESVALSRKASAKNPEPDRAPAPVSDGVEA